MSLHIEDLTGVDFTPEQLALWQKIAAQLKADPQSLHMASWEDRSPYDRAPECGTTRCVAGWAIFLSDEHEPNEDIYDTASRIANRDVDAGIIDPDDLDDEGRYSYAGRKLLGLPDVETANDLFLYSDDEQAEKVVQAVAAGETPKGPVETDE